MDYESPPIITSVGKLLRQPVSEENTLALELLRYDLLRQIATYTQLFYDKRKQFLWPKDAEKNFTELDRITRLNADTSIIEKDLILLRGLETIIQDRLKILPHRS